MKVNQPLILLVLFLFEASFSTGQVRIVNSSSNPAAANSSAFIDASSNATNNSTSNIGKGLLFPRTDLTAFSLFSGTPFIATSYPTRYDGMIVYNTATGVAGIGTALVTPGFYYYSNQSTTNTNGGQWVRMANEFDLKTTPSGPAFPTSPAPSPGDVFYNTTGNSLYYYNGTYWVGVLSTLSGTTLPNASNSKAGDLFYDTSLGANSSVLKVFNATTNTWDPVVSDGSITDVKLQALGGGALAGGSAGQVLTSAGNNQFKWVSAGVSSVGLSLDLYSTPTAVTSVGTLSATLLSQPAGTVLSAPASAAGTPSFRKLGVPDLSPFTTDDVPQGATNKYYTPATVLADLYPSLSAKQDVANMTSTIAADGTNKLYPSVNGVISYVGTTLVDVDNKITQNTSDISKKLDANSAITASSNYSIVNYDTKGLVTSGKVPSTDDISDAASGTHKYVTPAQVTILGNTTGTNSGDQTLSVGSGKLKISGATGNNVDVVTSLIAGSGLIGTGTTGDITLSLGTNAVGTSSLKGSSGALTNGGGNGFVLQSNGDGTFSWKDITSGVAADPSSLALGTGQFYIGDASSKASAISKNAIALSGFGAPVVAVGMGGQKIISLSDPSDPQDAATKNYVDTHMPASLVGAVVYKGTYNASTGKIDASGDPLPAASSSLGYYYVVSTSGTMPIAVNVGDWVISDGGTTWSRVANGNITYNTDQVPELTGATNKYYTDARVNANPTVVALGTSKEDKSNKATAIITEMTNTSYPSVQAVKNYVDARIPTYSSTNNGQVLTVVSGLPTWQTIAGGGTVTKVSVITSNGVSGSVATDATTPAITLTLGDITPNSIYTGAITAGAVTASSITTTGTIGATNLSGNNTGDQGIAITGSDIAGTPNSTTKTTSIALSVNNSAITSAKILDGTILNVDLAVQSVAATNLKNITVTGTSGQVLTSDGGGGFAWGSSSGITSVAATNGLSASTTSGAVTVGINDAGIAYSKLANLPAGTLLGYSATGNAALTSAQAKTLLGLSNVEDTKLSTWAGTSNLTTVGTIAAGTWNGTTIDIAHGGTGKTIRTDAVNALLPDQTNNSGKVLQTNGTDVSWASVATGSVTSVGLSLPSSLLTVSNSPVTGSGVLTANLVAQKTAYVLAGPASGTTDLAPTFRALVAADIPTLNQNTTGTASTVTTAAQPAITSVGTLTSLTVSGAITGTLSGNATSATSVGITDASPTVAVYPTWVTGKTGNLPLNVSSTNFSFVPSTGVLTATSFAGNINASNLNTGTIPALRYGNNTIPVASIAAGTPSASTYLRGDGSWATPTAGLGTITSVAPVITDGLTVNGSTSVAATSGAVTLGINTASVDLTKLKTVAAGTLLGNNTAGVSSPLALTAAQAKALLTLTKTDVGLANVQNLDQTNASNITSGTLAGTLFGSMTIPLTAIAATGTPSSTTYLRGDGTWSAASGGGSGTDPNLTYTSLSTSGQIQAGAGGAATIPLVTSSIGSNLAGLMTPLDKKKLDDMASVTNSPTAGYVLTALSSTTASWQALAITYTAAAANGSLAITGGNTVTLPAVTPTAGTNLAGLMIPADKTKLNTLPSVTNAPGTATQVLTSNADGTATWKAATGGSGGSVAYQFYHPSGTSNIAGNTHVTVKATGSGITFDQTDGPVAGVPNRFTIHVPTGVYMETIRINGDNTLFGKTSSDAAPSLYIDIVYADATLNNSLNDYWPPAVSFYDRTSSIKALTPAVGSNHAMIITGYTANTLNITWTLYYKYWTMILKF